MQNQIFGTPLFLLRGIDIASAVRSEYLGIRPFDDAKVQPTSYDLGVSQLIKLPSRDLYRVDDNEEIVEDFDKLVLAPGHSYLFLTLEEFSFPLDMIAQIYLRSRYGRLLNSVEFLGWIEAGWRGRLVLEITNHTSSRRVEIRKGEMLATMRVYQLESPPPKGYEGRYLGWPNPRRR